MTPGARRGRAGAAGLLLLGAACGCGYEDVARARLEAEGYTEVSLTPTEEGFTATAKKGESHCEGSVHVRGGAGSYEVSTALVCRAGESAPRQE